MIADAISQAKRIEQAKVYDQHERALADSLASTLPQRPILDDAAIKQVQPFVQWCKIENVRHAPARPVTIAAFILNQTSIGVSAENLLEQLRAIERIHDHFSLANPVATLTARAALERAIEIDAPRSWAKSEKAAFALLPADVKLVIQRREQDRETALRRAQNEAAELRKLNKAESAETEKEKDDMAKKEGWQKGEGPYSKSDDFKLKQIPEPPFTKGRDISKVVDANNTRNEGFSAKLDNPE